LGYKVRRRRAQFTWTCFSLTLVRRTAFAAAEECDFYSTLTTRLFVSTCG